MSTIDEKLYTFDKLIVEDAIRARDLIRNQLRQESEQRIADIKAEIKREAAQEYQKFTLQAAMQKDSKISRANISTRKQLINERNDIIASVLNDLKDRLKEFTQTDGYAGYLIQNIKEALAWAGVKTDEGGGAGYILSLTPRDSDIYAEEARKYAPGISIQKGDEDMIGGVRVSNGGAGVYVDNSFKMKVELCADELFLMSGLTVDK